MKLRYLLVCVNFFLLLVGQVTMDPIFAEFANKGENIYINMFKFHLKDSKYLDIVKSEVMVDGFVYDRKVISTYYVFQKKDVSEYSVEPFNITVIEHLQMRLQKYVISIEQDYERFITTVSNSAGKSQHRYGQTTPAFRSWNFKQPNRSIYGPFSTCAPTTQLNQSSHYNIKIAVTDARFHLDHPNLIHTIALELCYDFVDNDGDPGIDFNDDILTLSHVYSTLSHGTKCMGRIGAAECRGCDRGVAPNVYLVGIRMLTDFNSLSDTREARALSYKLDEIHVFSCSYGIVDNKGFHKVLPLTNEALKTGANTGRTGLGRIFVYPSGNGHIDNCNADGYASSVYTITVANIRKNGMLPANKEICPCALAATVGEGYSTSDLYGKCTSSFGGASAATAVGAGYIGELLKINPEFTKRDIEHIIVQAANTDVLHADVPLRRNGAGLKFNDQIGFGRMDFKQMKTYALNWTKVEEKHVCSKSVHLKKPLTIYRDKQFIVINTNGCHNETCNNASVMWLEHVQLETILQCPDIANLQIWLTSPMNTSSPILTKLNVSQDNSKSLSWTFMSVHFWGENPKGKWTVKFIAGRDTERFRCKIDVKRLVLHGTANMTYQTCRENYTSDPKQKPTQYTVTTDKSPYALYKWFAIFAVFAFIMGLILYMIFHNLPSSLVKFIRCRRVPRPQPV